MSLILVDGLKDRPGTGGPKFPNGLHLPAGIGITGDGHINMAGVCTFSGNVTIGGTLTYEDVTNIDSVGVVTARSGVNVSGGEFKVGTAITVGSAGVSTFFGAVNLNRKTTVNATLEATEGLNVTAGIVTVNDYIQHAGDTNTAIRFPSADTVTVETSGSERIRVSSTGQLGINTVSAASQLEVNGGSGYDVATFNSHNANGPLINIQRSGTNIGFVGSGENLHSGTGSVDALALRSQAELTFAAGGSTERLRISSAGLVGIGTNNPAEDLHIGSNSPYILLDDYDNARKWTIKGTAWFAIDDTTASAERLRIDSSGRLLIGHSASRAVGNVTSQMQLEGTDASTGISICRNSNNASPPYISLAKSRAGSVAGNTVIQDGDGLGSILFSGADGTDITNNAASITAYIDGTPGGNDTPGRLVFATTADGGTSPTERLRITSSGDINIHNRTAASSTDPITMDFGGQYTPDASITHQNLKIKIFSNASGNDSMGFTAGQSGISYVSSVGAGHLFYTAPSAVDTILERMRITHEGKIGINVTSPSSRLHVKGITSALGVTDYPQLTLQTETTSGDVNTGSGIMFMGHDGNGGAFHATIRGLKQNSTDGNRDAYLSFGTRANGQDVTEKMRITSDGKVRIAMEDFNSEAGATNYGIQLFNTNGGAIFSATGETTADQIMFMNGNGIVGRIRTNASATSYETSSDYRLKENQVNISDGITRLKTLKPYKFNWISDSTNTPQDGFFAHEVTSAVPEAVLGDKDATKDDGSIDPQGVDYGKLTPLLTAALQEAIAKIETLETKVAALESN